MCEPTRILFVDDEASVREVLTYQLEQAGLPACEASSAAQAQALIQAEPERFDLVVSDVRMPEMSGLELLAWIKAEHPAIEVILVSAFADVDVAVDAMRQGAADYLAKPVKRRELLARVHRCLAQVALRRENEALRRALRSDPLTRIVGVSQPIVALKSLIRRVASSDATVLVTGESGTGKELVARALHDLSGRSGPFVSVNCGAIPAELLETELFGHERGAFTGATRRRIGRMEQATGGTLLLDEVGELRPDHQVKLLRVLQERVIERIGGNVATPIDVRVVAATHRDLAAEVREGRFRSDLYFRLAVLPIAVPPLRDRPEDIQVLARHFAGADVRLSSSLCEALEGYHWPGNVRELRNQLERMRLLSGEPTLTASDFRPDAIGPEVDGVLTPGRLRLPTEPFSLPELEREIVEKALWMQGGNRSAAARYLGIPRHVLIYRLEKYGIDVQPGAE